MSTRKNKQVSMVKYTKVEKGQSRNVLLEFMQSKEMRTEVQQLNS